MHVYLEASPTEFNGLFSHVSVCRRLTTVAHRICGGSVLKKMIALKGLAQQINRSNQDNIANKYTHKQQIRSNTVQKKPKQKQISQNQPRLPRSLVEQKCFSSFTAGQQGGNSPDLKRKRVPQAGHHNRKVPVMGLHRPLPTIQYVQW